MWVREPSCLRWVILLDVESLSPAFCLSFYGLSKVHKPKIEPLLIRPLP